MMMSSSVDTTPIIPIPGSCDAYDTPLTPAAEHKHEVEQHTTEDAVSSPISGVSSPSVLMHIKEDRTNQQKLIVNDIAPSDDDDSTRPVYPCNEILYKQRRIFGLYLCAGMRINSAGVLRGWCLGPDGPNDWKFSTLDLNQYVGCRREGKDEHEDNNNTNNNTHTAEKDVNAGVAAPSDDADATATAAATDVTDPNATPDSIHAIRVIPSSPTHPPPYPPPPTDTLDGTRLSTDAHTPDQGLIHLIPNSKGFLDPIHELKIILMDSSRNESF